MTKWTTSQALDEVADSTTEVFATVENTFLQDFPPKSMTR
jgi:hypothetical protein